MKNITPILFLIFLSSCKETSHIKTNIKSKEYVFDYNKEKIDEVENTESFLYKEKYKIDNFLKTISKEEFVQDSLSYNNDVSNQNNAFTNYTLQTSYGQIKFVTNNSNSSDSSVNYSYLGFSESIKAHLINLDLYEGERTLIVSNQNYKKMIISGLPFFSLSRKYAVSFKDNEGLSSKISIYNVENYEIKHFITLWSDTHISDYVIWDRKDNVILKLRKIDTGVNSYVKIPLTNLYSPDKEITKNSIKVLPQNWKGTYEITTKAISNYNKREIDLLYTISITSNDSGVLSIGADQSQDYWCEGNYYLTSENNILHGTGKCDEDDTNDFFLKSENEKYYIKSKRFLNKDWQILTKEN